MFKAGDKVRVQYDRTEYTINERCPCNAPTWNSWVLDNAGIFDEKALILVSPTYTAPVSGTYNLIRSDGSTGTITVPEGMSVDLVALKQQAVYKTECAHSWRSYFGLNERYDFCTACDKKREHA